MDVDASEIVCMWAPGKNCENKFCDHWVECTGCGLKDV